MEVKINDIVEINGRGYTISKIVSSYYRPFGIEQGWFIEFYDTKGVYYYWKQYLNGGELIQK